MYFLTGEKVHLSLLKAQGKGSSLPYSKAPLHLAMENTYNPYKFHPDNGKCKCKSDSERKETGRGMIFSLESSCCQMQELRMKVAAEFNLLCSGCRKVHDFSQGQRERGVGKGGSRKKSYEQLGVQRGNEFRMKLQFLFSSFIYQEDQTLNVNNLFSSPEAL